MSRPKSRKPAPVTVKRGRGRPSKGDEALSAGASIRLKPAELASVNAAAATRDESQSVWLRDAVLMRLQKS